MKIFNIMLGSGKGGLEQMAVVYAKALVDLGHDVTCMIMADCPYIEDIKSTGSKLHIIKSRSVYNIFNTIKILKSLNAAKADIAVLHGNRAMSLLLNKVARLFVKCSFKTMGIMHNKKCKYLKSLDAIVFLTNKEAENYSELFSNKISVLPNTILEKSHQFKPVHHPVVFGAMGRLHQVKGYDILLQSVAILKNKGYQFKFVLGGEGPDKEKLLQQIKDLALDDIVEYIGWVADKEGFFNKIDIFCMSSRSEQFPLVLLEVIAFSKAIVSFNLVGPVELLSGLSNAIIVKEESAEAFAVGMEHLLNNPILIEQMAKEGNELFNKEYALSKFAEKLQNILEKA